MFKGELFSTDMVRAYLEGRKKHTCRPIVDRGRTPANTGRDKLHKTTNTLNGKPFFGAGFYKRTDVFEVDGQKHIDAIYFKAKFRPGDYMYARETWGIPIGLTEKKIIYKADFTDAGAPLADGEHWRPSIHMPKEAARLFFRVAKVEVMRLEDVTEQFAIDDGFQPEYHGWSPTFNDPDSGGDGSDEIITALSKFRQFWYNTYGLDARWVWVYWTEPVSKEETLYKEGDEDE